MHIEHICIYVLAQRRALLNLLPHPAPVTPRLESCYKFSRNFLLITLPRSQLRNSAAELEPSLRLDLLSHPNVDSDGLRFS